ncbi:MAG: hypothetical protein JWO47_170 [Candidatus Saccharibacteria bacterium]|nr:hypothetical protein [Candidatus Saccharibacteria bacterium]
MNTTNELSPAEATKDSVLKRLRISRYIGRANLVAMAAAGAVNGDTIIRTGFGITNAAYLAFTSMILGGVERYKAFKSTNNIVMDFERSQYNDAPLQKVGGDVIDIKSRKVVREAVEEKTVQEPPTNPPMRVTETTGYIGTFSPFPIFASGSVAYQMAFGETSGKGELVSGTALSLVLAAAGVIANNIGERSLAYQQYVCEQRIDTAALQMPTA